MPASINSDGHPGVSSRQGRGFAALAAPLALFVLVFVLLGLALRPAPVAARPLLQDPATPTPAPGTGSVAGQAWIDTDADGAIDAGEQPLAGMTVTAQNSDTGASATAVSAADGKYRIVGLAPGIYHIGAVPPAGYALTTEAAHDVVVMSGATLTFNFGARVPLTPTPTPTRPPLLDVDGAEQLTCGGVYTGNTLTGKNNVSSYGCRPWWDESGNEKVYRLELSSRQPVTVTLLSMTADLDLFLLRYAFPDSCLAAGDNYLSYSADAGPYFLSVDGYHGAMGDYAFRVDCPDESQATPTPTYTPSATPTNTPTGTPAPTFTPSPTQPLQRAYLPMLWRAGVAPTPRPVTFVLQDGSNGYTGTTDTTLSSWEPASPHGSDKILRLFHARDAQITSQMEPALRFDLSLLPSNATVEKAVLRLYVPATPLYDIRARVTGLLRSWEEVSATWEVATADQPWTSPGASAVGNDRTEWASEPQHIVDGSRWYDFDVTSLVSSWSADPERNFGMLLEALAGDSNANVEVRFVSREGDADSRPQLVISYTVPLTALGQ